MVSIYPKQGGDHENSLEFNPFREQLEIYDRKMRVLRRAPERADQPVALTIGNFDGVHLGHQAMLKRLVSVARTRNMPSAVLTFEPQPQEFFAPDQAPARLTSLREKLELLDAAGIDLVLAFRFDYQMAQMPADHFVARIVSSALGAKWLLVGDDFRFGARRSGNFDVLSSLASQHGFEVETTSSILHEGTRVSSTVIRACLRAGDLDGARRLLGRPYTISGRVEHGDGVGRGLGYPTANVRLSRLRAPLSGIFVVEVEGLASQRLRGVASLGVRPTVKQQGKAVLEVHLFDFNRDIYGTRVRVQFLAKLRDEVKFANVDELVVQMGRDAQQARDFFSRRDAAANDSGSSAKMA